MSFRPFYCILVFTLACNAYVLAQSTVYTIMGGPSIGNQKWDNNSDQSLLFRYHGALRIETLNQDEDKSSVFAQVGYHIRGSRQRFRFFTPGGGVQNNGVNYQFRNLSLLFAAKSKKDYGPKSKFYYYGGVRGEYNLSTNLTDLSQLNPNFTIYYPSNGFVRKWTGGFSGGAGFEFNIRELIGAHVELALHPDFTLQYNQPAIGNIIDPNNPGNTITLSERRIRNFTLEISTGIRLIKKVVYVD
jgi:hypothetical protein